MAWTGFNRTLFSKFELFLISYVGAGFIDLKSCVHIDKIYCSVQIIDSKEIKNPGQIYLLRSTKKLVWLDSMFNSK